MSDIELPDVEQQDSRDIQLAAARAENRRLLAELDKAQAALRERAAPPACSACGCEERDHRGILTCRCPESADPAPLSDDTLREMAIYWYGEAEAEDHVAFARAVLARQQEGT